MSKYVECEKEEHSHTNHDDGITNQIASLSRDIRDRLDVFCRDRNRGDSVKMAFRIIVRGHNIRLSKECEDALNKLVGFAGMEE